MKKQLIPAVALAAAFVILLVGYFAVLKPLLADKPADDPVLPTPVDDIEQVTDSGLFLLFPYTTREYIQSFSVTNEHGSYRFYRDANDSFVIDGHETVSFANIAFSALINTVGYPLASSKVCDNATPEQLAEYGLDEPVASWTIETIYGKTYSVEVGDQLLDENGSYYCRFVGRDSIYTLSLLKTVFSDDYTASTSTAIVLDPIEAIVTASLTPGLNAQNYYMVNNIMLFRRGDEGQDAMPAVVSITSEIIGDTSIDPTAASSSDEGLTELTFQYPAGYQVKSSLVWDTIYMLATGATSPRACLKLGPDDSDFAAYGLDNPYRVFRFTVRSAVTTKTGATRYEDVCTVTMIFGDKLDDGMFPMMSNITDKNGDLLIEPVILAVPADDFSFIEQPQFSWIATSVFPENIRSISSLRIKTPTQDVTFFLHHSVETSTILGTDGQLQTQYKYLLDITTDTGLTIPQSESDNFRYFYITLLGITIRGESGLTEEETAAILADESRRALSFTYTTTAGHTYEIAFYYFTDSGRRVLVSVKGKAEFYVFASDVSEIDNSLTQLLRGIKVDPYNP